MQPIVKRLPASKLLVLGCVLALSSCYKKARDISHSYYDGQEFFKAEAQLTDIPFPVQVTPRILSGSTARAVGLTFVSHFLLNDLVRFYQFEMERLGWKELHLFSVESEILLVFEKPQKFCTVSIRPDNRVVIFFDACS